MSAEQVAQNGTMGVDDAIAFLNISRSRLYGLIRSGELPSCNSANAGSSRGPRLRI